MDNYQPRVIGLDIYRDIAQEPGREQLLNYLQNSDRAVSICKLSETSDDDDEDIGVAPPPNIPENRLGFSDFALDNDGVVRRTLLLGTPEPQSSCQTPYSFSLQLVPPLSGTPKIFTPAFKTVNSTLATKPFPSYTRARVTISALMRGLSNLTGVSRPAKCGATGDVNPGFRRSN
uniref:CHASE2 domain-containing protein n=1 Tax=Desertifilum tharense IPPAS B-1220 TaxID=1781255 RepID=A0ACD5H390_9CYAN